MSYSWRSLGNAYALPELTRTLEEMESKYHGRDETEYFASLVNTSISKKQPYHRWMRYREGYAGDLVKELLKRYPVLNDEVILDPMCGSGSTIVACNELGNMSLGLDVNPYAVLSTKVKGYTLTSRRITQLRSVTLSIVDKAKTTNTTPNSYDNDVKKYFIDRNFKQIVSIKSAINSLCKKNDFDFFFLALLMIIEDCSNRKKDGNGLATRETKISDCFQLFHLQVEKMLEDFTKYPYPDKDLSQTLLESATNLDSETITNTIKNCNIGSIVFSPPYANSFDYFESYKMELIFGEWTHSKDIHDKRKSLIRNFRLSYKDELLSNYPIVELLCTELWQRIPEKERRTGKRDGRTRLVPNMLRAYFDDMSVVIEKGMNLLKKGGHMHIVVDQSAYVGVAIPTDTIFAYIADTLGYEVIEILKCRKANTSAQQLKQHPYLKDLLRETIVTIKKT